MKEFAIIGTVLMAVLFIGHSVTGQTIDFSPLQSIDLQQPGHVRYVLPISPVMAFRFRPAQRMERQFHCLHQQWARKIQCRAKLFVRSAPCAIIAADFNGDATPISPPTTPIPITYRCYSAMAPEFFTIT